MLCGVMRIEIEVFLGVCGLSIHVHLYAVMNPSGYSVQKGNAVVFFKLFSELYGWVNGIQVIVKLLHIFFFWRQA